MRCIMRLERADYAVVQLYGVMQQAKDEGKGMRVLIVTTQQLMKIIAACGTNRSSV